MKRNDLECNVHFTILRNAMNAVLSDLLHKVSIECMERFIRVFNLRIEDEEIPMLFWDLDKLNQGERSKVDHIYNAWH